MSETDYLTILVAQSLGVAQSIQPLIPPMFSPAQFPAPIEGTDVSRPLLNDEFFQAKPVISRRGGMHHTSPVNRATPVGQRGGQGVIHHAPTEPNQVADLDWKISLSHPHPRVPDASMPTSEHGEPTYGRYEATSTLNDASQVPGYNATDISSENKTNPLQLQSSLSISRDISEPSLSHTSISQPIYVPQGSISIEPSLLGANGQPQGSTPSPTHPPPLRYNEKDVREAHPSVYSRGEGGRVGWGGPLRSPVEPPQATDSKNLRSPVEPPIAPEPIMHTKTNPSNFVGIDVLRSPDKQRVGADSSRSSVDISLSPIGTDSPRPHVDVSHSPVGTDFSRLFSSNEQLLEPVRVTIGRVEVRATPPAQEPSKRTQVARTAQPTFSLQEYLEQRRSGKS